MARRYTAGEAVDNLLNRSTAMADKALGVQYALVTNVADPLHAGRIKVRFGWQKDDEESAWIPPAGGYAGPGFGSTFHLPQEDMVVKIGFLGGNMHNPEWIGAFFTPGSTGNVRDAEENSTPLGAQDGRYDARKDERRNILRTMSGWLIDLIEGASVTGKWRLLLQSPTGRDFLRWLAPGHDEGRASTSMVELQVDDFLTLRDALNGTALFVWDAEKKQVILRMHDGGRVRIESSGGNFLELDDRAGDLTINVTGNVRVEAAGNALVKAASVDLGDQGGRLVARETDQVLVSGVMPGTGTATGVIVTSASKVRAV